MEGKSNLPPQPLVELGKVAPEVCFHLVASLSALGQSTLSPEVPVGVEIALPKEGGY